ncbi:hypothetical protein LF887_20450 [Chryseobacterium sp. MEBOG06]|uniref:hypothetical protein n=1 Tax=Chryseobacterium sp. MEBOG06 TaxID=2879938 RepID=UPI001F2DC93E|nr:hypothetical protein [Chryseobacterium sp. MEBOG06]UKB83357.1 hypothetical protein LF887_20450 [Chryseobacterium sp. MEBOG06]
MGTLHEVYQLQPKVLTCGAILRVRKDQETLFLEKYAINRDLYNEGQGIFSNTFVTHSDNGKVRRYALYAKEKIIDFEEPGVYISIQDGSKNGFGRDFDELIHEMSPYLEDTLFYVIWDFIINRYEIKNGKLHFKSTENFSSWNYNFEDYLLANYTSSTQLIADFYVEKANELILLHNRLKEYGNNPNELYEIEEYEELLANINNHKKYISIGRFTELENWLKVQINEYES